MAVFRNTKWNISDGAFLQKYRLFAVTVNIFEKELHHSLRKKCPYLELFWSEFFPRLLAFGLKVRMRGNAGKMRTRTTSTTNTFYAVIHVQPGSNQYVFSRHQLISSTEYQKVVSSFSNSASLISYQFHGKCYFANFSLNLHYLVTNECPTFLIPLIVQYSVTFKLFLFKVSV